MTVKVTTKSILKITNYILVQAPQSSYKHNYRNQISEPMFKQVHHTIIRSLGNFCDNLSKP